MYEFIDGNHGASKLRIIPYIGADFFTLGLAELVLWPMEIALLQGAEGRAVVTFDQDNRAKSVMVTRRAMAIPEGRCSQCLTELSIEGPPVTWRQEGAR